MADNLGELPATALCLDRAVFDGYPIVKPLANIDSDHLAYIIFTSGSTGNPKGVIEKHRPAVNLIEWVNNTYNVGPQDRLLFTTSLCFDLSVYDVFGILAAGGTIYIASESDIKDARKLASLLDKKDITFWDSAPAALNQVAPFVPAAGKGNPKLRLAFLSGDWIPLTLPPAMKRAYPNLQVVSLGGATEATIWSNSYPADVIEPEWNSIPYGHPIHNARYFILDEHLEPSPIGVAGDLYIGGQCLSSGYFGQPDLTAHQYIPDPFSEVPGRILYRTGDRARRMSGKYADLGTIEFLGRLDHQVKVRGFRIELGEIENTLIRHRSVREALAMIREDQSGDRRIVAYFIADTSNFDGDEDEAEFSASHVSEWQEVFDNTYQQPADNYDPSLNISGWNDSFTGEQIPALEMREWADETVARILDLQPRNTLENRLRHRHASVPCCAGMSDLSRF